MFQLATQNKQEDQALSQNQAMYAGKNNVSIYLLIQATAPPKWIKINIVSRFVSRHEFQKC